MVRFMVPSYVDIAERLPKTPTGKSRQVALRQMGVTPHAFDRERAGVALER